MIDDQTMTIEWRGITLHREPNLAAYRQSLADLFDLQEGDNVFQACRWTACSPSNEKVQIRFWSFWVAEWEEVYSPPRRTPEEACAECDTLCRQRGAALRREADVLLRGLSDP